MVPELPLPFNQIDDYLICHHKIFIKIQVAADSEVTIKHQTKLLESSPKEDEQYYWQRGQGHDGKTHKKS